MIFKSRKKVTGNDKTKASKGVKDDEFYLIGDLDETQLKQLEALDYMDKKHKSVVANIINDSADYFERESLDITLLPSQVYPVLATYINKRFYIGDEPGLGKTIMSAASYAFYKLKTAKQGEVPYKCMVVTDNAHVSGFAKEWTDLGINMVAWEGRDNKIYKKIEKLGDDLDGIVCSWSALRTNSLLGYFIDNHEDYRYGVFDETSAVINPKSITSKSANAIINEYGEGMERVIFLNGSSFEKNIYDYYYQFNILKPNLIPSKSWLDKRYVIKKFDSVYRKNAYGKVMNQKFGNIVDYKNQEELKERLKYFYIARSKEDFAKDGQELPEHEYSLFPVEMGSELRDMLKEKNSVSVINSPSTGNPDMETNRETTPKIGLVVDRVLECIGDRPVVYCVNIDSQDALIKELEDKGVKVGRLNGSLNKSEKKEVMDKFNNFELEVLVINVRKAINLPTSNRLIFYNIPTIPQTTTQIRARIDRNNYTTVKKYDFFCYLHSPEMVNLVRLGYFREVNANKFTGQVKNVYQSLVNQLEDILDEEEKRAINDKVEYLSKNADKKFEDVKGDLEDILTF